AQFADLCRYGDAALYLVSVARELGCREALFLIVMRCRKATAPGKPSCYRRIGNCAAGCQPRALAGREYCTRRQPGIGMEMGMRGRGLFWAVRRALGALWLLVLSLAALAASPAAAQNLVSNPGFETATGCFGAPCVASPPWTYTGAAETVTGTGL